jgi:AraC-like DNA-binding protein
MKFDNPILFFLCSLGVFNGLLVSLYFLFFSKQKRIQNILFGLLVLLLSMRIGKSVYVIFTPREERDLWFIQLGLSACFLIGVTLFYYLKASIGNKKSIPKKWKLHFGILFLVIVTVGFVRSYEHYSNFWNTFFVQFIYVVWGGYIVASGIVIKDVFKKLVSREKATTAELWLVIVYMANALIFLAYIIGYFHLYLVGTITFSVVFYVVLIFFLSKNNRDTIFQDIPVKYATKKIESTEACVLVDKLDKLMKEKQLYKEANVKLLSIAKELQITPHKLSQLLNDNIGKSLATFLNDYRVEEAKVLLKEKQNLTLETIGFEAGFSSKSNFYATFKKTVGQTPLQYQKQYI